MFDIAFGYDDCFYKTITQWHHLKSGPITYSIFMVDVS